MTDCLLILFWPDFSRGESPGSPYSAPLVAHALQRQLSLRHRDHSVHFFAPDEAATAAFCRWGFEPLPAPPSAADVEALAAQHPAGEPVILAMAAERAAPAAAALEASGRRVEVWTPGEPSGAPEAPGSLAERLHLRTTRSVGLLVDWDAVAGGVRRPGTAAPARAASLLVRHAELTGALVAARFYGTWESGPVVELAGTARALPPLPERGGEAAREADAEEALRGDLLRLLDDPSPPDTWILVADAPWLPNLIRRAHGRGIRVLLWSVPGAEPAAAVRAEADGCADLGPLLAAEARLRESDPQRLAAPAWRDAEVRRDGSLPPQAVASGARLNPWVRMLYHTECTLRRHQWPRIAFRKLASALAEHEEFGPTAANALMWLNRAKAEGLLLVEQETHRADPAVRITVCRPNPEHPVARVAGEVPERCLRLLRQMLQKMPWVSFKLLRSVLVREQWLGGPAFGLDETSIDEWLNFLVHDGAITLTKEPNLENPDYPVTALRLNETHPLARSVVAEATEGKRLAAERAILTIDHFLTRNRKPWMAMSALRRSLESLGREELQAVLQGLQNLGALVTDSYPNPQKEHFTTGCHLNTREPLVAATIETRNRIVRAVQGIQRFQSWVPLSRLDGELASGQPESGSASERLSWFLLLRDEGLLELDQEAVSAAGWGAVQCRLNVADAVVRSIVAAGTAELTADPCGVA